MCSYKHTKTFNPRRARIRVDNDVLSGVDLPLVCKQCKKPKCKESCPADAFELNEVGVYTIDHDLCTGCGICVEECPFDAIFIDPVENVALKCDLCNGAPQCVLMCRNLPYHESKPLLMKKEVYLKFMPGILDNSGDWQEIKIEEFYGDDIDELFNKIAEQKPEVKNLLLNEDNFASDQVVIMVNDNHVNRNYKGIKNGDVISVMQPVAGG